MPSTISQKAAESPVGQWADMFVCHIQVLQKDWKNRILGHGEEKEGEINLLHPFHYPLSTEQASSLPYLRASHLTLRKPDPTPSAVSSWSFSLPFQLLLTKLYNGNQNQHQDCLSIKPLFQSSLHSIVHKSKTLELGAQFWVLDLLLGGCASYLSSMGLCSFTYKIEILISTS